MAKKKQYKKKAILRLLNNKTIYQAMAELDQLCKQGYGNCKIEISAGLMSGPGYWQSYNSKVKCNVLVPITEIEK